MTCVTPSFSANSKTFFTCVAIFSSFKGSNATINSDEAIHNRINDFFDISFDTFIVNSSLLEYTDCTSSCSFPSI